MKDLCKMYHDLMEFGIIVGPVFTLFITLFVSTILGVLFDSPTVWVISCFGTMSGLMLAYFLGSKEQ